RRLVREGERDSSSGDDRRLRRLRDALGPLQNVAHRAAATVARELLGVAWLFVPDQRSPAAERLRDAVDDIRGRVALFGEDQDIAVLCAELETPDPDTRYRAAGALRP